MATTGMMKKADRWIAVLAAGSLMLALTACGGGSTGNDSDSAASDATEAIEETAAAATTVSEENSTAADTTLPAELEEGEIVLEDTNDITGSFTESTVPDLTVDWSDDKLGSLYVEDTIIDLSLYPADSASPEGVPESLTLDAGNSTDFTDPNTVLYGDLSKGNASVIALQNYGDPTFFAEHPYFYIYLQDKVLELRVFAAYTAKTENILVEHNCYDETEFAAYVQSIMDQRDLSAVTDDSVLSKVIANWWILTIDLTDGSGEDFLIQAVITGMQR